MKTIRAGGAGLALVLLASAVHADPAEDVRTIASLDTAYQAAVERNDADAMAAILHKDMILVLGNGSVHTRDDLLEWARTRLIVYEHQVEDPGTQTVRLYGKDTAIVTARLYIKAVRQGEPIEFRLWFSDTYVRTANGWRYVFGQASTALPAATPRAQ
jgi:ketosteroid isomerase-like protein